MVTVVRRQPLIPSESGKNWIIENSINHLTGARGVDRSGGSHHPGLHHPVRHHVLPGQVWAALQTIVWPGGDPARRPRGGGDWAGWRGSLCGLDRQQPGPNTEWWWARGNQMFLFNPRRSKVLDNNLLLHHLQNTKSALILAQSQRQFVKYRKDTNWKIDIKTLQLYW